MVNDTLYRTYLSPPFNAIFVESYENLPKEDNYLMKTFLQNLTSHFFVKTLMSFFSMFLNTYAGNMLFVDNTPYKNMFNSPYNAIFWEPFYGIRGED